MTFVARVETDATGRVGGIVEHVRSGVKERFSNMRALRAFINRMVRQAESSPHVPASGLPKRS